jgi:hypothetical protein
LLVGSCNKLPRREKKSKPCAATSAI